VLSCAPRGATTLYTAHEHWLICPTHVLWRHRREPCDKRECLRCQLRYHRPPQLWRRTEFFQRQLRHVDTFIALSEFSRAKHHEFGFPFPMEVLPPLVADAPLVAGSDASASPHPRPYFLCVARLEPIKGLHTVIPCFQGDAPADLIIAGAGSQEAELRALAGGSPRIHFVGRLTSQQLWRYYRHAIAHIAASFGGLETLIEQPAIMSFFELTDEQLKAIEIDPALVRLSVGIEDTDDVVRDVVDALSD
jgi:glycosyltransferase involved in cell wall biosynthesis